MLQRIENTCLILFYLSFILPLLTFSTSKRLRTFAQFCSNRIPLALLCAILGGGLPVLTRRYLARTTFSQNKPVKSATYQRFRQIPTC